MKLTPGHIAERFRGGPMFPGLIFPMIPALTFRPKSDGGLCPLPRAGGRSRDGLAPGTRRKSTAASALSKCGSRAKRARSGRRSVSATKSSTRRCRPCPARSPCCRAATRTTSTPSSIICSWSMAATPPTAALAPVARGRHLSRAAPGGGGPQRRLLHAGRIRHRAAAPRQAPDQNFIELGRSCVLQPYRNKRTLELLWQGVWGYVREHGGNVMIGCASFAGTDPSPRAGLELSPPHRACACGMARPRA